MTENIALNVKYNGTVFEVKLDAASASVEALQAHLAGLTHVQPADQKLIGLPKHGGPSTLLSTLRLKPNHTIMLVGTPASELDGFVAIDRREVAVKQREAAAEQAELARLMERMRAEAERQATEERSRAVQAEMLRHERLAREQLATVRAGEPIHTRLALVLGTASDPAPLTGNTILLPQDILARASQANLRFPLAFRLSPEEGASGRPVCCAVKEFTAAPGCVAISPAVWLALGSPQPSALLTVDSVDLPRGKFVQLTALAAGWGAVPETARGPLLEAVVRAHYSVLSLGDVVSVQHMEFVVTGLRPADAVLLVDTDIEVQVLLAGEAPAPMADGASAAEPAGTAAQPLALFPDGTELGGTCAAGGYAQCSLDLTAGFAGDLSIELAAETGDPDLYLCLDAQQTRTPTIACFTHRAVGLGSCRLIIPQAQLAAVSAQALALAVHAYGDSDATFRLRAHFVSPDVAPQPTPVVGALCEFCQRPVPPSAMLTHGARCARIGRGSCDVCGIRLELDALAKHVVVEHVPVLCECGAALVPADVPGHRQDMCPLRRALCV